MKKTYIIAEKAQGFEGNPWLCKKYIDLAKKSGADAVKFQIFPFLQHHLKIYLLLD